MNLRNAAATGIRALAISMLLAILIAAAGGAGAAQARQAAASPPAISAEADVVYSQLENKNDAAAQDSFRNVKKWWTRNKAVVKQDSLNLALEIDKQVAALSLSLLNGDHEQALNTAASLRFSLHNYEDGAYEDNSGQTKMTLAKYVAKLQQAKHLADAAQWPEAAGLVKQLQSQWLSVEGDVVARSQSVYAATERDLVLADGYLAGDNQRAMASPILERMVNSLSPLVDAGYSWLDAALIPLREGLEAVLVVGTLLMAAARTGSTSARRWVAGGSALGLLVCLGAGFAVALIFSSEAFGGSNSLINGWTGIFSSLLLLYVSYWLHRHADISRWNGFLNRHSDKAASSGRRISFGLLAFFAILREGLETVLFMIGLAGKMSLGMLAGGIAAGLGMLIVIAWLILKAGARMPVRPLFLASSIVVFYLCFKFLGSGVHSLQMAGLLPSTIQDYLPQWTALSLYPSWYSTLPQLVFVLLALAAAAPGIWRRLSERGGKPEIVS